MAAAWSLYLSFGVILILSNCAFAEVTNNDPAKKNDTNSNRPTTDRNVSSVTAKLSKHSTATMNTSKASTSLPASDGLEMLDSESSTSRISGTIQKNTTQPTRILKANQTTANIHRSFMSRQTIAYTTPSILRLQENQTKGGTEKDENDKLYIGFRNLDDGFKNQKFSKKSSQNQSPTSTVIDPLMGNVSSQNSHKILTLSTQSIKNDSFIRNLKSSTAANTPSREFFPTTPTYKTTLKPITLKFTEIIKTTASSAVNVSETSEIGKTTRQTQPTSPFDINSLREKFIFIGNLTGGNSTTERSFLTLYDESTLSVEATVTSDDKSTNITGTEMTTTYDLPFNTTAVTARERLAANATNNLTTRLTPSQMQLINISSSVTSANYASTELSANYSIPYLGLVHKNVTSNRTSNNQTRTINKEHLQFPGITLKVSHVLIPKQKRSRYNIQNMRIELPKNELLNRPSAPTPKNSNCTRFPIQVVTASDTETKQKVNLTEEHYDCEYSPELNNTQKEPAVPVHTYFGGYVFRYTVPKVTNLSVSNQTANDTVRSTVPPSSDDNDDYYSSYMEYSDPTNGSSNSGMEDGIFPDPYISKTASGKRKSEALSDPLPDTSLTDSDLHDHDVIDSVMYIYFGGATHGQRGAGRQIIIVGAVIALVAQFLTLASSIRRIKTHKGEEPTIILLNVETALTLTNLIFILGVQSTSDHTICKVIAVTLYYLHIATLFWFLLSSVYSVQIVCQIKTPFKLYTLCIFGWFLPFISALLSYVFNERSFETTLYCWVSPLRGILISYISPVILLCIICIVLTIIGLKNVTDTTEDFDDTYSHKKLLRISAVALPLFAVIWFTGMVSLENSASLLFSLIFLISDTVLNWLLFACWLPSEASQWKDMDDDYYDEEEDFDDEPVLVKRRFDDQPLLSELYEYGAQGQLYNLRVEPISIISTP